MTDTFWETKHKTYASSDWIDKPSLFAQDAIRYFPPKGRILELGAGQGQDSRFFAEHGYQVTSTDYEASALKMNRKKLPSSLTKRLTIQKLDLNEDFPFTDASFDVVYAHLSIHYFDTERTYKIFDQITRVLKPGGIVAIFVNSIHDPQYNTGTMLEPDYFKIDGVAKRFFSITSMRAFVSDFYDTYVLDEFGETYKDAAKGVHNLVRYIGSKPISVPYKSAVPCVGAILERENKGGKEVFIQTRWKPGGDPKYSGTLEFPIGRLDKPFENIFDTLAHEIKSEAGLTLKRVHGDARTPIVKPQGDDAAFGFRPFCCVQQLRNGKPWIGFIFICEVMPNEEPRPQLSESKDSQWMVADKVAALLTESPNKFFTLELPAWKYYFSQKDWAAQ